MKQFFILIVISLIDRSIDAQVIAPAVPCKENQDCLALVTNQRDPTCKEGFCVCLNEQQKLTNCSSSLLGAQQDKTLMSPFYQQCKFDRDCSFNNSFCNTTRNQCECMKGYVQSVEKRQCLKVAQGLSFPCLEDKQCLAFQPNTTCVQQQCICVNGYHAVENVCWKMIPFGSPCTKSEECYHINGALCTDKHVCGCGHGTIVDNSGKNCMLLPAAIGEYCSNDEHCSAIEQAVCNNHQCQCLKGRHFVEEIKKCIVNRDIDEPCQHDYDCYQAEHGTSSTISTLQCIGSLCDCKDNYHRQIEICVSAGAFTSHFSLLIILSTVVSTIFFH